MKADRGTVPHVRESHDSLRLSPITKYWFGPSLGQLLVS